MAQEKVDIILQGEFKNKEAVIKALKDIDGNIGKINFQSKEAVKTNNSLFSSLKKVATAIGIAYATKKIFDFVKAVLTASGQMEQYTIAFTTMLGSAEKAKVLLKDLSDFTKKTPFDLPGVVNTAKQLIAYGIAVEDVIPTLKTLGDVSAGVGVEISRLGLVYGQVKSTGKLLGQDLNQFTQAGVPLLAELASMLNKTEGEIIKMKESGLISFDLVKQALTNMASEGGAFYNLMENQNKSFLGQLSNLGDSFFRVKTAIGDALLPIATKFITYFNSGLEKLETYIKKNQQAITNFAVSVGNGFVLIWKAIQPVITAIGYFASGLMTIIKLPIVAMLGAVSVAIILLKNSFLLLRSASPFGLITIAIQGIITLIGYLKAKFDTFSSEWKIAILEVAKTFKLLEAGIIGAINEILNALAKLSKVPGFGWTETLANSVNDMTLSIGNDIDEINKKIQSIQSGEATTTLTQKTDLASGGSPALPTPDIKQIDNQKEINDKKTAEDEKLKLEKEERARQEAENIIAIEREKNAKLKEVRTQFLEGEITQDELQNEIKAQQRADETEKLQEEFVLQLEQDTLNDEQKLLLKENYELRKKEIDDRYRNTLTTTEKLTFDIKKKDEEIRNKQAFKTADKLSSDLVGLERNKNSQLQAVGKAAADVQKAKAIYTIGIETATGAISAYQAMASIPYVGPALGVAAAGLVIAYGAQRVGEVRSASYAVGTAEIPTDQMAQIHKGEMIIPATFAESIRQGELSLSGGINNTDNNNSSSSSINIEINFEGAIFNGEFDNDTIIEIGTKIGKAIQEDLLPALPTRQLTR